jgi:hypothetical protein
MVVLVDRSPFVSRAPGPLDRAVLSMTGSMPANRLGLRPAIGSRRLTAMRSRDALDVQRWADESVHIARTARLHSIRAQPPQCGAAARLRNAWRIP